MENPSAIMVHLPESFGAKEARKLERELKKKINGQAPSVIMDLSRTKKMDSAGLEGLLMCMQEIAKHDGSVQLGALSPEAATILELARMDYLFSKFPALPAEAPSFAVATSSSAQEVRAEGSVQPQPAVA